MLLDNGLMVTLPETNRSEIPGMIFWKSVAFGVCARRITSLDRRVAVMICDSLVYIHTDTHTPSHTSFDRLYY